MATTFGGTIKLKGETEYKRALSNINASLKANASELKLVDSAYLTNTNAQNKFKAVNESLSRGITAQRDKVSLIQAELKKASAAYGENSNRTLKLQNDYNNAATELNKMSAALNKNEAEMKQEQNATQGVSQSLSKVKSQTNTLGAQLKSTLNPISGLKTAFKGLALTAAATFSVAGVISWSKSAIETYKNLTEQTTKLNTVMKERLGASKGDVKSVIDLTTAQSKMGVVTRTAQIQGAQQLGTFVKHTSSLKSLIPAMNNLAVQQNGVNTTGKDMQNIGNMMGKVFTGQIGALKRVGISFDDNQAKMLKNGTEQQKAAMLAKIITENVGHMNSAMAKTDAGKIANADNRMKALKTTIGQGLLPIVANLKVFAANTIGAVVSGIGTLKNVFEGLINSFKKSIIGAAIIKNMQSIFTSLINIVKEVGSIFAKVFGSETGAKAGSTLKTIATAIGTVIEAITKVIAAILKSKVTMAIIGAYVTYLATFFKVSFTIIKDVVVTAATVIIATVKGVQSAFSAVEKFFVGAFSVLKSGINAVKHAFGTFGSFVEGVWSGLLRFIKSIPKKIISVFKDLPSNMKTIGENLLIGLWNGVTNKISWIIDEIKGLGKKIVKGLMHVFGMKSPPKHTFADGLETSFGIGQYFTQGLSNGMEDSLSSAMDSAKKIASKVSKSMQPLTTQSMIFDSADMNATLNVKTTSTTPNGNSNKDVIAAINGLQDTIANAPSGNVYHFGNMTYDDGSAVGNALGTLARAIKVEQRK